MKIKLSKLRKIINEELSRQLNEADGDAADKAEELRMKSLRDKVKNQQLLLLLPSQIPMMMILLTMMIFKKIL